MASGDNYIVIDNQTYLSQQVVNAYAFNVTGTTVDADAVAATFIAQVLPAVQALQSSSLLHTTVQVYNASDLDDFVNSFTGVTGNISGEGMPPYVCEALLLTRSTRASRNGHKRYAGVVEGAQNGGLVTSGVLTLMTLLANILAAPIVSGDSATTLSTRIWRRARPATLTSGAVAEAFFAVSGVVAREALSTQNTRKFGRGA